jgi:hypothetical protein
MLSLAIVALTAGCADGPAHAGEADAASVPSDGAADAADALAFCPVLHHDDNTALEFALGSRSESLDARFEPLVTGTHVWLTPGEQGLQHILLAFQGRGFEPGNPFVQVTVVRADDCAQVAYSRFRLAFQRDGADRSRLALGPVRILVIDGDDPTEYCTVLDRDVVVIVDFDDGSGHAAHREVRAHVAGIDPNVRSELRQSWLDGCARRDAGMPGAP